MQSDRRHISLIAHDNQKAGLLRWDDFIGVAHNLTSADLIISSPLLTSGTCQRIRPTFGERDPYEIISADERARLA